MPHERQDTGQQLIEQAADVLRNGGLVAYPTDTVYGLAADPTNAEAVHKLSEAKKRDPDQPMPHLIASADSVAGVASDVSSAASNLMRAFWPGALTIILRKAQSYESFAAGETIGLRVPDHLIPRELSRLLSGPITGTSANVAGGPEPLSADDVRSFVGNAVDLIIDGGACSGGQPSTVIDCTRDPPMILRLGAVSREEIERVLGRKVASND
ncbi:MAG: threonylcarbamoyl-AMP synthase [Chloroflexi bacterium]|nr:threonylcarbamoyl-AMP synthase [Chloroflexota bacterium]